MTGLMRHCALCPMLISIDDAATEVAVQGRGAMLARVAHHTTDLGYDEAGVGTGAR